MRAKVAIAAIALLAVVGAAFLIEHGGLIYSTVVHPSATNVEGELLSIENASAEPHQRYGLVRLPSGETVRASIPVACVVVPGQTVRMAVFELAALSKPVYSIIEGWGGNAS